MEYPEIRFGASLGTPRNAPLRARVEALAATLGRLLVVDSVLALSGEVRQVSPPPPRPVTYLLFDIQHVFLYDEAKEGAPRIDSALRYIIDGYGAQPFELLARHVEEGAFEPSVPLESLDLLTDLWAELRPGILTALGLTTGQIERATVTLHPASPEVGVEVPPDPGLHFQQILTDASLRQRSPSGLEDFVSRLVGVVRRQHTIWEYMSLPVGTGLVMWNRGRRQELCFGKGAREESAAAVAICEALERYQVTYHRSGEELIYGTPRELAQDGRRIVNPQDLFFGRSPACPGDILPVFNSDLAMHWTRARSPLGDEVLVPAQDIWFSVQDLPGEPAFIEQSTNGCALGSSVEEAALFALFEAIERDAYLLMWYLQRPCAEIDPDSIEDESFQILRCRWELEFRDYSFHLFDITADTAVPAVAAMAVRRRGQGPKTFHGAAARLSAGHACRVALEDIASFSHHMDETRRRMSLHLLSQPDEIAGPADHGALYALDEPFERLGFLDFDGGPRITVQEVQSRGLIEPDAQRERYDLREVLERLCRRLEDCGAQVFFKDITHPAVGERGLRCVKAITPGLYPLWFGHRKRRFRVTPRLERLGGAPPYNLEVHPFV
jgi:thiazole/oxazole-forming peptide maturase SagD family component